MYMVRHNYDRTQQVYSILSHYSDTVDRLGKNHPGLFKDDQYIIDHTFVLFTDIPSTTMIDRNKISNLMKVSSRHGTKTIYPLCLVLMNNNGLTFIGNPVLRAVVKRLPNKKDIEMLTHNTLPNGILKVCGYTSFCTIRNPTSERIKVGFWYDDMILIEPNETVTLMLSPHTSDPKNAHVVSDSESDDSDDEKESVRSGKLSEKLNVDNTSSNLSINGSCISEIVFESKLVNSVYVDSSGFRDRIDRIIFVQESASKEDLRRPVFIRVPNRVSVSGTKDSDQTETSSIEKFFRYFGVSGWCENCDR
ncbi:hypothetical protein YASMINEVIRUS_547 [Yasminevirus sp. GU-2018]|uniref:Uncharacterized protein n=1 Tax=Yasminevirus sp. GU-2018 TaxID=2420051 RepID=A0A5K0U9B8_9VIRU|nr:hypothetical protein YASMINEVIRUS_547 [Yasminevirus sp. GU-2018]